MSKSATIRPFGHEERAQFLDRLRQVRSPGAAARLAGLGLARYEVTRERRPEFAQACDEVAAENVGLVEGALLKKALGGDNTAMTFYLTNRSPERWRPATQLKLDGDPDAKTILRLVIEEIGGPDHGSDRPAASSESVL